MITCPKCGRENVDDSVQHCGFCGAPLRSKGAEPKKTIFGYQAPSVDSMVGRPEPGYDDPMTRTIMDEQPRFRTVDPAPAAAPAPPVQPRPAPVRPEPPAAFKPNLAAPASLPSGARTSRPAAGQPPTATAPAPSGRPSKDLAHAVSHDLNNPEAYKATMAAPLGPLPQDPAPAQAWDERTPPDGQPLSPATLKPSSRPAYDEAPPEVPPTLAPGDLAAQPPALVGSPSTTASVRAAQAPDARSEVTPDGEPEVGPAVASEDALPEGWREPGRVLLRVLQALGGAAMIGLFFAPWGSAPDGLLFSWDLLKGASSLDFVRTIYLAAGGLVLLSGALIPLPYLLRALVAMLLGLVPLALTTVHRGGWGEAVSLGGLLLLIAALFHRRRFKGSILARILVVVGVVAQIVAAVVPQGDVVPIVAVFKGLGSSAGLGIGQRLLPLYLLLFSVLSLMALRGRASGGLAGLWALLLLLYLPLQDWFALLVGLSGGAEFIDQLPSLYHGLVQLIAVFLSAYGLSQVLAKMARPSSV